MATTAKGYPYPAAGVSNNVPGDVQLLAQAVDDNPGIASLSTVQRDALAGANRWTGRIIWNTTSLAHERWTGSAWVPLADAIAYGATAAALGAVASGGAASTVSRSDHVHPAPTPAEIGAASVNHTHSGFVATSNGTVSAATPGLAVVRNITLSTSDPSGGSDGDVWIKYT